MCVYRCACKKQDGDTVLSTVCITVYEYCRVQGTNSCFVQILVGILPDRTSQHCRIAFLIRYMYCTFGPYRIYITVATINTVTTVTTVITVITVITFGPRSRSRSPVLISVLPQSRPYRFHALTTDTRSRAMFVINSFIHRAPTFGLVMGNALIFWRCAPRSKAYLPRSGV